MQSEKYKNLSDMHNGARGFVTRVALKGSSGRRLIEMGLLPGTQVRVLRRAPFGDPIEIRLRGYSLSVRAEDARRIFVSEEEI